MITWIGLCAGEIWHHLEKNNSESSIGMLLKDNKAPEETIWMALGWLAREGYVMVGGISGDSSVRLLTK